MRSLSAAQLLEVWERGTKEHPVERALTLLSACCDEPRSELAALSIGRRNAHLLEIYERLFGSELEAFAQCPQCGERLEYHLTTRELSVAAPQQELPLVLEMEETSLRLRLPNSTDLRAASEAHSPDDARRILLDRCVVETLSPHATNPGALPDSVVEKIASCLAQADPQAEALIDLSCCACQWSWQVLLDIEVFLWTKISALARRLLREVHVLARAYAWQEHDILGMSALRRQAYLEMAGS
jgi:hypothetical protein